MLPEGVSVTQRPGRGSGPECFSSSVLIIILEKHSGPRGRSRGPAARTLWDCGTATNAIQTNIKYLANAGRARVVWVAAKSSPPNISRPGAASRFLCREALEPPCCVPRHAFSSASRSRPVGHRWPTRRLPSGLVHPYPVFPLESANAFEGHKLQK